MKTVYVPFITYTSHLVNPHPPSQRTAVGWVLFSQIFASTDLAFMLCGFYAEPRISRVAISSGRTRAISHNPVHTLKAKSVYFGFFANYRHYSSLLSARPRHRRCVLPRYLFALNGFFSLCPPSSFLVPRRAKLWTKVARMFSALFPRPLSGSAAR